MAHTGAATVVLNAPAPDEEMAGPESRRADRGLPMADRDSAASDEVLNLFELHGAALCRFARAVVREPQDAEDVVQTAFVRLLQHLRSHGDRSNLKGWLFTVAANLCRDQLRRRKRWLPWGAEHDRLMAVPPDVQAGDPAQLFLDTMRLLRPRDRMLLALRAQGLSYRQIAAAAHVRETSVGRLLARALARWQRARAGISHT